jgi:hypothetical protein
MVALGVELFRYYQDILRAKLDAEITSFAALSENVEHTTRDLDLSQI